MLTLLPNLVDVEVVYERAVRQWRALALRGSNAAWEEGEARYLARRSSALQEESDTDRGSE